MRLTLRTLLAWLDGVLPGDEQQEIGAKVASSAVATHLADRIRAAVCRAAIGAPKTEGRGLTEDPNSVAEYLDNTLASDQLEAFERICIDSEMHMAEVAACHGILAELVRDPSVQHELHGDERQRVQQRLRGLLAGLQDRPVTELATLRPRGDEHRESRETARAIREALAEGLSGVGAGADGHGAVGAKVISRGSEIGQRPMVRRSSLTPWLSAAAAVGLLLALSGTLVWTLLRQSPVKQAPIAEDGRRPSAVPSEVAVAMAPQETTSTEPGTQSGEGPTERVAAPIEPPAAALPPVVSNTTGEPSSAAQPSSRTVAEASPAAKPTAPNEAPVEAGPGKSPEERTNDRMVMATSGGAAPLGLSADAVGLPANAVAPPSSGQMPAVARTTDDNDDAVGFVGGEGVLLHRAEGQGAAGWSFLPAGSPLGKREELLVPPVFQPELHVRGVTIRLLPETCAVLSLDHDGTPRIEVVFGRAVARASRTDARLGITAAGLVGTVDAGLLNPVAIEVELDRFPGADPVTLPPVVRSRVAAVSRGIVWRQTAAGGLPLERPLEGIEVQGMLEAGLAIEWTTAALGRVVVLRNRPLPAWVESGDRIDKLDKSAGEALAAKVATTAPLTRGLRELAADRRAENRMLAAATLAMLGEFDELVEQLAAESPGRKLEQRQWSQFQAATVPLALARGGNAAKALQASFVNRGPHGKADALWAMARGFTDEDLAGGVDRALVEALDDPSLIVRRYAITSLVDITQPSAVDRSRYRPDGLPEMRREGVNWWRNQLEKGLVRRGATAVGDPGRGPADRAAPPSEE